ncbi:MAG TPA: hypothetical protein V6C90_14575 [Coleofasciculaceae cyanobacterium]
MTLFVIYGVEQQVNFIDARDRTTFPASDRFGLQHPFLATQSVSLLL